MKSESKTDRPELEIEVTEEMIERGASALRSENSLTRLVIDEGLDLSEISALVLRAAVTRKPT